MWDDPWNTDPAYTRVRLRTEVLPLLEDVLGGGVAPALARTAALLREDLDALDAPGRRRARPAAPPTAACRRRELAGAARRPAPAGAARLAARGRRPRPPGRPPGRRRRAARPLARAGAGSTYPAVRASSGRLAGWSLRPPAPGAPAHRTSREEPAP